MDTLTALLTNQASAPHYSGQCSTLFRNLLLNPRDDRPHLPPYAPHPSGSGRSVQSHILLTYQALPVKLTLKSMILGFSSSLSIHVGSSCSMVSCSSGLRHLSITRQNLFPSPLRPRYCSLPDDAPRYASAEHAPHFAGCAHITLKANALRCAGTYTVSSCSAPRSSSSFSSAFRTLISHAHCSPGPSFSLL